jgi:hypothetical protein
VAEQAKDVWARNEMVLPDHWILSSKEYESLQEDSTFLENLRAAGVDNWDGYHLGYGYADDGDEY